MKIRIDYTVDFINQSCFNAYSKSIQGESIHYHGSHPDLDKALLIRCKQNMNHIIWQSDELTPDNSGFTSLCWYGGIAGNLGGPHLFELWANGKHLINFSTTALNEKPETHYPGNEQSELYFDHQLTDMCKDHFGFFTLKFKNQSKSVLLELKTQAVDSEDWMMVFEYPLSFIPKILPVPLIIRKHDIHKQILRFTFESLQDKGQIRFSGKEIDQQDFLLHFGHNQCDLEIPLIKEKTTIETEVFIQNHLKSGSQTELMPVSQRQVHLLAYSHNDIGYTAFQDKVAEIQKKNIDMALKLIEQSTLYPPEAVNRWNLEVIWILLDWWQEADEVQREKFSQAVKNGYIGLNALYANPLSGLCNLSEMNHHFDLSHQLEEILGIKIKTATVTDIPGFVWSLLPAMAQNGVRYFSIAPNNGDRVGFIYEGLGDKPFWWISPSGTEKVLTWVTGSGYSLFHKEKITENGVRQLIKYLSELDTKHYPYEICGVPYTIGGDNGGPDDKLSDFVKNWNEQYVSPHLIVSTHEALFTEFEARYGDTLPEVKGDMTPYWEDGAMSSACETVLSRRSADFLISYENFSALYGHHDKSESVNEAWKNIVLWDEHTWGAWNSVSHPDLPFVKEQWQKKQSFALNSWQICHELQNGLLSESSRELYVFNPISLPGSILLKLPDYASNKQIFNEENKPLTSFRINQHSYIPVHFNKGLSSQKILMGEHEEIAPKHNTLLNNSYENRFFKIVFDINKASIISLYDKINQIDLISKDKALAELIYIRNRDLSHQIKADQGKLISYQPTDFADILHFQAEMESCRSVEIHYLIHHHQAQIDIVLTIDKMPVREKESLHFSFPFQISDSVLRYDSAGAPVIAEKEQITGMCRNFICPTSYADISNQDFGVTIACIDSPLIEKGGLSAEMPWLKESLADNTVYAYLMNNIWHTNYKADQEGITEFRFSLLFHQQFSHQQSFDFAMQNRLPAIMSSEPFIERLNIDFLNQLPFSIIQMKYSAQHKAFLIMLLNTDNHEQSISLSDKNLEVFTSNPAFEKGKAISVLNLKAFEQRWIMLSER